jgi:uncharacterized membrane protein SpoIIM required for sporulation
MNVERFIQERLPSWTQLGDLATRCGGRAERLAPVELIKLGALYRAAAADLAIARRRYSSEPVVQQLERLVGRTRPLVYATAPRRGTLASFFTRDYWVRVLERPDMLGASAALLFVPAIAALMWGWLDPERASGFVPGEFSGVSERRAGEGLGIPFEARGALSSFIFTNNIRVTLLAFALGITFGLGTAFVLINNGVLIGVLGGLTTAAGTGSVFVEYVVAHGVLELSCIVVGGAAGLRLGWAIVAPGHRTRTEVIQTEGRAAVEMILGTAPWLVLAGLIEGFITPQGLGLEAMLFVGFLVGGIYWALAFWRGRREPNTATA